MGKISGFIISIILVFPVFCNGQDTIRYPIEPMKGIRIGIDVSKLLLPVFYPHERFGFEATADIHIKNNIFAVAEAGWLKADLDKDDYSYRSNGYYAKVGADYNVLKPRIPHSNDILYIGARYGFSLFSQEVDDITILGYYWPDAPGQSISQEILNAHWLEFLLGIKAEVLKNFYVGITLRGKLMLVKPKSDYSSTYVIPGYGSGTSRFVGGINYYVSYNFRF